MKILLFNDNPVVRKLVALSAQKTKDDLSVIWSVDEIEESGYDLLIIDDALYSNEVFDSLKEHVTFQSTLLMATRGNAVPAGFDNVINKPFLPTDLVDMFIQIEKKIASNPVPAIKETKPTEDLIPEEPLNAINLDETLPVSATDTDDMFDSIDLDELDESGDFGEVKDLGDEINLDDELNLDDFEHFDDKLPEAAILDKEELQEVQGLLEDTENDDWDLEEEITVKGIDEEDDKAILDNEIAIPDDFSADFDSGDETLIAKEGEDELFLDEESFEELKLPEIPDDELGFGDIEEMGADIDEGEDELSILESGSDNLLLDEANLDDFELPEMFENESDLEKADEKIVSDEADFGDELLLFEEEEKANDEMLLDDDELGDLELQIQDAVNDLEPEDLESELELETDIDLDAGMFEDLALGESDSDTGSALEGFDELDMLDERELKLAIGEEVEDEEVDIHVGASDHTSLSVEALDEAMGKSVSADEFIDEPDFLDESKAENSAEGVEALQALLKALSNEEVAKSLKGLNISININFGNGA